MTAARARAWLEAVPALERSCSCLCGMHHQAGAVFPCEIGVRWWLTMTGGLLSPAEVPMCGPCGRWWKQHRPERVASAVAVIPRQQPW